VDFPAATICSSGRIEKNLEAGFWQLFLDFLAENDIQGSMLRF
jgi:hypothetical protein